jgi:hypothetical protein
LRTLLDEFNEKTGLNEKDKPSYDKNKKVLNLGSNGLSIIKVKTLNNRINFGQYKGSTLKTIIYDDPSYIRFLLDSRTFEFKISEEAMKLLEQVEKDNK